MTLREVVDLSLLTKSVPDEKTTKNNMDFLQNVAQKMEKTDQQKMQAVIDGMKKTELFTKAQKEEQEKQKKLQQTQKPESNIEVSAQLQNTSSTAQSGNTDKTAQSGTN